MSEKQGLKIAIIGSGSTYTPELIDGFIRLRETLPVRQFMFMDIDDWKRTIVGELCIRMLQEEKMDSEAILTADLDEAVRDADYVITQIRVGKLPARILDETIPPKYRSAGPGHHRNRRFYEGPEDHPGDVPYRGPGKGAGAGGIYHQLYKPVGNYHRGRDETWI